MKLSKEKRKEHTARVRQILVMNPEASILQIKKLLEQSKYPLKIGKNYINKIVKKIHVERAERINHATLNKFLGKYQDEVAELNSRLWKIINDPISEHKDKISAIKALRDNNKTLFDKMFESGIFEKKLGELKIGPADVLKMIRENVDKRPDKNNNESNT